MPVDLTEEDSRRVGVLDTLPEVGIRWYRVRVVQGDQGWRCGPKVPFLDGLLILKAMHIYRRRAQLILTVASDVTRPSSLCLAETFSWRWH
jgi:hypothetical protein